MIVTTNRLQWATQQRGRYLGWARQVQDSPYTLRDRLEFALISAHCPLDAAVRAWQATRTANNIPEIIAGLRRGVGQHYTKAAQIAELRGMEIPEPTPPFAEYRRRVKLPGLGPAKLSFGLALYRPLDSDVVCLDTHIARLLGVSPHTLGRLPAYEHTEATIVAEAAEAGLPPFVYQWALWDWQRGRTHPHDFLWRTPTATQGKLF